MHDLERDQIAKIKVIGVGGGGGDAGHPLGGSVAHQRHADSPRRRRTERGPQHAVLPPVVGGVRSVLRRAGSGAVLL